MFLQEAGLFDLTGLWSWLLLFTRIEGMFFTLPGLGGKQMSMSFRSVSAIVISLALALAGVRAPLAETAIQAAVVLGGEFLLGAVLGEIPAYIVSGVQVAGQVMTGTIGLGQAHMLDPSLGDSVSVLGVFQSLLATLLFLMVDGHHTIIRAVSGVDGLPLGQSFIDYPAMSELMVSHLSQVFYVALSITAPVIATLLVTQFVLGLVTRFVPQVNVFIVSLPLTIGLGLYIIEFTIPGMFAHLSREFASIPQILGDVTRAMR